MKFEEVKPYIDRMCKAELTVEQLKNAFVNFQKAMEIGRNSYRGIMSAYFMAVNLILGEQDNGCNGKND